jgi:pimeloyl-ACP methyl ester carboxylesterase
MANPGSARSGRRAGRYAAAMSAAFEVASGPYAIRGARSGSGPPLVFLHGLGSDRAFSAMLLDGLAGFELVLPDLRGHGAP